MEDWFVSCSGMTKKIQEDFEKSFEYTSLLLSEHEKDLLRSFKAKLMSKLSEFHALVSKREEAAASWISRVERLERDFERAKETGDKFQTLHTQLLATNRDLAKKTKIAHKRRARLVEELVLAKKRRDALREEGDPPVETRRDFSTSSRQSSVDQVEEPRPSSSSRSSELATKKLIDQERSKLLFCRQEYAVSLRETNDLRELLRLYCKAKRTKIEKLQCRKPTTPRRPRLADSWDLLGTPQKGRFHPREKIVDQYELQLRLVTKLGQLAFPFVCRQEVTTPDRRRRPRSAFATTSNRPSVATPHFSPRQRPRSAAPRPVATGVAAAKTINVRVPTPQFSSLRRGADGNAVLFSKKGREGISSAQRHQARDDNGERSASVSFLCEGGALRRRPSTAR